MTAWANGFAPALVERMGWCLVHSIWQGAVVALSAAVVLRSLRRSSAQSRYVVACGGLLAMVFLPLATPIPTSFRHDSETSAPIGMNHLAPESSGLLDRQSPSDRIDRCRSESLGLLPDPIPSATGRGWPLGGVNIEPILPWMVGGWAAGVFVLSLRLLGGWIWIQWLVRRGSRPVAGHWVESLERLQAQLRLKRPVRLMESARLQVPLAVGWLRPVILLPVTAFTGVPVDQWEAILAHELAHIGRHDYLVNLVQSVVETLLFYHPAAWWISARIRAEREYCCDDSTIEICGNRLLYARALAALEEQRCSSWLLAPSARDGSLVARIRRLLGASPSVEKPAGGLAGIMALATVALLAVGFVLAPAGNQVRAADEPREAITGSVVTPDGKPVFGADVWLVAHWVPANKAKTLAKTQTDQAGRFRLLAEKEKRTVNVRGRAVWAHKPGLRVAAISSRDQSKPPGSDSAHPVLLTLAAPSSTTFRVVDSEGTSVLGAEVAFTWLDRIWTYPPAELAERLSARTWPDGRATLPDISVDMIREVRATCDAAGIQTFYSNQGFKDRDELILSPVLQVEGRVIADDPAAVRGVAVHLSTIHPDDRRHFIGQGEAHVVSDDQGRFRVKALARGKLYSVAQVPEGSMYRSAPVPIQELAENGSNIPVGGSSGVERVTTVLPKPAAEPFGLEIPLKGMVRVRGAVREKRTGAPVPNVGVIFGSRQLAELLPMVVTNAKGQFEAIAPPDENAQVYLSDPSVYLSPLKGFLSSSRSSLPISRANGQLLPAIELERGETVRGLVVDGMGKPVAGAIVVGKWEKSVTIPNADPKGPQGFMARPSATAMTNAQGEFALEGIEPGVTLRIEATAVNARGDTLVTVAAGAPTPVRLVVKAKPAS